MYQLLDGRKAYALPSAQVCAYVGSEICNIRTSLMRPPSSFLRLLTLTKSPPRY